MTCEQALAHVAAREQSKLPVDLPMARELVAEIHRQREVIAALEQQCRQLGARQERLLESAVVLVEALRPAPTADLKPLRYSKPGGP